MSEKGADFLNPYKKPEFLQLVVALELVLLAAFLFCLTPVGRSLQTVAPAEQEEQKKYIKWVDFTVTKDAMYKAFRYDVDTCQKELPLNWIQLLAYLGAVLGGMVWEFEIQVPKEENSTEKDPEKVWVRKYGLKAFSPIARYFPYEDYDDFGASRSYGYKRPHLGHDMMGQVGTPIIAVESGCVEAIGWNQYGGWRLGIRSFDKKRYYYYAHLRKNYPYHKSLKEGSIVQAGDVIGYMGRTGYSQTENTNNIEVSHLHFGLQLIFDESQKEGNNEIWIDCYELVKFLALNRSETVKDQETKEYDRVYEMRESGT